MQYVPIAHREFRFEYNVTGSSKDCPNITKGFYTLHESKAYSGFLQTQQPKRSNFYWYEDQVDKSTRGVPLARTLANVHENFSVRWQASKSGIMDSEQPASHAELIELRTVRYNVLIDDIIVHQQRMRHGGVYTLLIANDNNERFVAKMFEITEANSMSMFWLVPQYVTMTLGEVMFSVTGLEFSYSQSPVNMKSVLQACWLLTVAFGNVLVVVVAELKFFASQANEFFLFAGLMFVDMLIFTWMAYRYIPNDPDKVQQITGNNEVVDEQRQRTTYDANLTHYWKSLDED